MTRTSSLSLNASRERRVRSKNGYVMFVLLLAGAFIGLVLAFAPQSSTSALGVVLCVVSLLLILMGFYMLQPNQAAVITLFGSYKGTDRRAGLRWVSPWMRRHKLSVRQQRDFGPDQGQRPARQPDRDGRAGGLARDRHGPGLVRRQ